MAIPILNSWKNYFEDLNEGLGSSYERIIINNLLKKIVKRYRVTSVLEAPIFGFTGICGLNSVALFQDGCKVALIDDNHERIDKISNVLTEINAAIQLNYTNSFNTIDFEDKSFDMAWNFSALWFVEDLIRFLEELTRVTSKVILIFVPNQSGLGYKWQKAHADVPKDIIFNEKNINPKVIKSILKQLNWRFLAEDYFDCPLWPDIGMSKEKFIGKYIKMITKSAPIPMSFLQRQESFLVPKKKVCILDYYSGKDPHFPDKMMRYSFLEKYAPDFVKKVWSHHRWMLFISNEV